MCVCVCRLSDSSRWSRRGRSSCDCSSWRSADGCRRRSCGAWRARSRVRSSCSGKNASCATVCWRTCWRKAPTCRTVTSRTCRRVTRLRRWTVRWSLRLWTRQKTRTANQRRKRRRWKVRSGAGHKKRRAVKRLKATDTDVRAAAAGGRVVMGALAGVAAVAAEALGDAAGVTGGAGVEPVVIAGGVSERVPTATGNTVTARAAAKVAVAAVAVPVGRLAEDDMLTAAPDDRKLNHPKICPKILKTVYYFEVITVNPPYISLLWLIIWQFEFLLFYDFLRWNGLPHEDSSEEDEVWVDVGWTGSWRTGVVIVVGDVKDRSFHHHYTH